MSEPIEPRQILRATREIVVNIHGEDYDCLLIPRKPFVEVDYTQFPEDDPLRRKTNIEKLMAVDLDRSVDMIYAGGECDRLTKHGAQRLLESL